MRAILRSLTAGLVVTVAAVLAIPASAQSPRPATTARVAYSADSSGTRLIIRHQVVHAHKGTKITVACIGGAAKGCPRILRGGPRSITVKRAGTVSLHGLLGEARLAKGAMIVITLRDSPKALFFRFTTTVTSGTGYANQGLCEQPAGPPVGCQ